MSKPRSRANSLQGEQKIILKGIGASSGITSGKVKIILKPSQCSEMREGDILVAKETTPEYVPAILKAKAIVTDFGGRLSHPAIVAREMGIPGVVGTKSATQILTDGMQVVIDGNNGFVFQKNS